MLVVGLDGADFQYVNEFSDSLVNISKLRKSGIESSLLSTHPPWTGSAWPSIYTGTNPSHHGIYDFFSYAGTYPDKADSINRKDVKMPAIWDYLTNIGLKSIVLNVPVTHPAYEIDGIQIPGYLSPPEASGYPVGIKEEILEETGIPYRIYSEHEMSENKPKKIAGYKSLIKERTETAKYLLKNHSWDFAFIQIQKTDSIFHNSTSSEHFKDIYRLSDRLIGELIEVCDTQPNIIICSDHGMGKVTGYSIHINEILRRNGYVEPDSTRTSKNVSDIKKGYVNGQDVDNNGYLINLIQSFGVSPGKLYKFIRLMGIEDEVLKIVPDKYKQMFVGGIDWRQSKAYCRSTPEQGIRINLEGRDPSGVVCEDDYDQIREEIIDILSSTKTPNGNPCFEYVCKREKIYDGPYSDEACDILYRTNGMNHTVSNKLSGVRMTPINSYDHKPAGVFIANGPDIRSKQIESSISIEDIAPIVFSLLNEPIPVRMTGKEKNIVESGERERKSYDVDSDQINNYAQDQSPVLDRLDDLGYL